MKRLFSFLLALAMLAAMSIPVFAAETTYSKENKKELILNTDPNVADGTITITNATVDKTYVIYKIFDAELAEGKTEANPEGVTYTLDPDSDVCKLMFGTADAPIDDPYFAYNRDDHRVTLKNEKTDGAALVSHLQKLVNDNPATFPYLGKVADTTRDDEGNPTEKEVTLTFNDVKFGYYLIKSSLGGIATLNSSAPTMTVIDKNQIPGIVDKSVKLMGQEDIKYNTTSNDVSIGDMVTYKIEFTATNYAGQEQIRYYEIVDTKGTGIWAEFNSFRVKINGQPVPGFYINKGGDKTDDWSHLNSWPVGVTPNRDQAQWYLVHEGYDKYRILIPWINDHYVVEDDNGKTQTVIVPETGTSRYDSPVKVEITYDAAIEPNANSTNLYNTARLDWYSRYRQGNSGEDTVTSKTYGLSIIKQDQATTESLAGAKFEVYKDAGRTQPLYVIPTGVDGVYMLDSEGSNAEEVSGARMDNARDYFEYMREPDGDPTTTFNTELEALKNLPPVVDAQGNSTPAQSNEVVTAANGRLVILGLNLGKYYFLETEAPDGYNKLEAAFEIEVKADNVSSVTIYALEDGSVTTNQNAAKYEYVYSLTEQPVKNSKGASLPATGGEGRMMLITIGSMIAMGFAVLLITQKKMSIYKD